MDQRLGSLGVHTDQEWTQPIGSVSGEDVLRDVARVASDSLGERRTMRSGAPLLFTGSKSSGTSARVSWVPVAVGD